MSDKEMEFDQKDILWDEYFKTRSQEARNEIAEKYWRFVSHIATQVERQLSIPDGMNKEDLIQWGFFGLVAAIEAFDKDKSGTSIKRFESYAAIKIRGKMIDQIRKHRQQSKGMTRTIVDNIKKIDKVIKELEVKNQKSPVASEIAQALEIPLDDYYKMLYDNTRNTPMSLDKKIGYDENMSAIEVIKNDGVLSPEEELLEKEKELILREAIEELSDNEKHVIKMRYYESLTFGEIGDKLKLSVPRISQLHKQALTKLEQKDLI